MRYQHVLLACVILFAACPAQSPTWTQSQASASPTPRYSHAMAYDSARHRIVLFGGTLGQSVFQADTWEWDGNNWLERKPETSPPARHAHAMVYDSARRRTVLFGGAAVISSSTTVLADTWEWDGSSWTQMQPKASPPPSWHHAMAYDSARGVTVFLGASAGPTAETWEWDGNNWTRRKPTTTPTFAYRYGHAMAYDSARKRTVLFGGWGLGDTWEWDGNNWTDKTPKTGPFGRFFHAMAYDPVRKRTVLFGGGYIQHVIQSLGDTWEWDGSTWTEVKPATAPPARFEHAMAYDSNRWRVVAFGGATLSYTKVLGDTWEYGGAKPTLTTDTGIVSIATGGTQKFTLDAGSQHASRPYWLLGSLTGTSPGVTLPSAVGSVTIPLIPDPYTDITIALPNSAFLVQTKAALDASGQGQASLVVPKIPNQNAIGITLYHAYLVYGTSSSFYLGSNPATLQLVQ